MGVDLEPRRLLSPIFAVLLDRSGKNRHDAELVLYKNHRTTGKAGGMRKTPKRGLMNADIVYIFSTFSSQLLSRPDPCHAGFFAAWGSCVGIVR
ncbi:MAG: hypothetical protein BWX80_00346 [Candidatus Hydrogenedentes bacterium ADurb.Bin101]|nr:MAG: hypothetical protein BWX80_00346 [Candidatus Hydrogenedentes bacterium ADurb.Bin101]